MNDHQRYLTEQKVLTVLIEQDSLCMDVPEERLRLAKAIALALYPEPKPIEVVRKVNDIERKVLRVLADEYHPEEWSAYSFKGLTGQTKLELKDVRRACRSLAKKGLAAYERSLVDCDGMMAGSGYRATEEGAALITPCDLCEKRAVYDYYVDGQGGEKMWDMGPGNRRVQECEEHHGQSAENPPVKQGELI